MRGFKINQKKSQFRNLLKIHLLFRLSLVSLAGYCIKIMFLKVAKKKNYSKKKKILIFKN